MRKYQRAIARNLMQLDGMPRVNKRIPGTRISAFSLYWRDWQNQLINRYYAPKKRRKPKWKKGGPHAGHHPHLHQAPRRRSRSH